MPPDTPTVLLERAHALSQPHRHALELLAVAQGGLTQTVISLALTELGHRAEGRRLSAASVRPVLELLVDRGLARHDGRYAVHADLSEAVCRQLFREDRFEPLAALVAKHEPLPAAATGWYGVRRSTALRELRRAVYSANGPAFQAILKRWHENQRSLGRPPRIHGWLTHPLEVDLLHRLPPDISAPLLENLSLSRSVTMDPSDGFFELVKALNEPPPAVALLRVTLAREALLAGQLELAGEMLETISGESVDGLRGLLHLVHGDLDASVKHYAKALAARRKREGSRMGWLPGPEGAFQPLAYLLLGTAARVKQARRLVEATLNDLFVMPDDMLAGHLHVRRLDALVHGQPLPDAPPPSHPLAVLLASLVTYWAGEPLDTAALDRAIRRSQVAGFHWLAGELSVLFSGDHQQAVSGLPPLAALRQPEADWERRLHALEEALGTPTGSRDEASAAGPTARVCWYLGEYHRQVYLEARVQRRRGAGWTKGRKVGVNRLHTDPGSVESMGEQDIAIAACLTIRRGRGWYRGSADEETWHPVDTWRALVGHPAVFLLDEPGVRVEVAEAQPQLVISQQLDELVIHVEPEPEEDQQVVVLAPAHERREVYHFDKARRRVVELLHGGLALPTSAGDRLGALLTHFTGLFEVHDESARIETQARDMPHDPRPVLRLVPQGAGLSAQLLARPFGEVGPTVDPGMGGEVLLARIDGQACRVQRDLDDEVRRAEALEADIPSLAAAAWWGDARHLEELEQALELLVDLARHGDAVRLEWPEGEALRLRGEVGLDELYMSVQGRGDWFEASGQLRVDGGLVLELHEILDLLGERRRRFVTLDDGRFLALTDALRRQLDLLDRLNQGRGKTTRFHRLAALAVEPLVEAAGQADTGRAWREQLETLHGAHEIDPALPRTLRAELRPYQVEGFTWLARLATWGAGACLADDMGLGKTVQALALLLHRAGLGPALVVAPTSVCGGWCDQAWRFAPTLDVHRFGPGNRAAMLEGLGPSDLVVCSYGLVQSEIERLSAISWSTLVLDESQAVKNPNTQRHKAVTRLQAEFRLATTGTPIENHLGELWALFQLLQPGLLGSWERFKARFAAPIEAGHREVQNQLRQLLLPFILRRTKSTVLQDLPPRTDIQLDVTLNREEAALYETLRERAVADLEDLPEGPQPIQVLAWLSRLRMACCNARLVLPHGEAPPSAKLEAFEEITDQLLAGGHRALVFSQFVRHLTLLREHLDGRGIPYQYLDGSTPASRRDQRVRAFQAGEGDLFLISLRAGGFGLNLTAADYVIHMDPWWNPAVEDQASDRAHRIGQTRPVTVYRLVAKGSIEEKIVALHQRKRDLADRLLAGADAAAKLGAAELLELIKAG